MKTRHMALRIKSISLFTQLSLLGEATWKPLPEFLPVSAIPVAYLYIDYSTHFLGKITYLQILLIIFYSVEAV